MKSAVFFVLLRAGTSTVLLSAAAERLGEVVRHPHPKLAVGHPNPDA